MAQQVTNPAEAIAVLVQVANLAQSRGILSFDDAVVTKSALDFLANLGKPQDPQPQTPLNGPTPASAPEPTPAA